MYISNLPEAGDTAAFFFAGCLRLALRRIGADGAGGAAGAMPPFGMAGVQILALGAPPAAAMARASVA